MEALRSYIHSLNPISDTSWRRIECLFAKNTVRKGEFFIKEGVMATHIAFLEHGVMRAFYRNSEGQEYNKHFFTAPCFIGGYASLITGRANVINQQAITDCSIWMADFPAFSALYKSCPDLETAARRLAELYFVNKEQREIEIVLLDADKRYLLFQKQYPQLEQLVPQYHIASYLGITPTQLSRIRRKFTGK